MTIEKKIRKLIDKSRYKHTEVAAAAGMTRFQLSKVLAGHRELAAVEFLRICLALKISPEEFLDCELEDPEEQEGGNG